jgi:hypothetical protein
MLHRIILLALLVAMPAVTACPSGEAHTTIPTVELPLPVVGAEEAADDIVIAPGGITYRANVQEVGEENPWPPIKVTNVTLSSLSRKIIVGYRDHIETRAGETRNNIFMVGREASKNSRLNLYATQIPSGVELTQTMVLGRTLFAVLVIKVAPEVAPGQYNFEIGLEVNGWDYGTVPCTIEVIE